MSGDPSGVALRVSLRPVPSIRTTGNTTVGAATGTAGGSYGGFGGAGSSSGTPNAVYGDYADPDDWGAGNSLTNNNSAAGGGMAPAWNEPPTPSDRPDGQGSPPRAGKRRLRPATPERRGRSAVGQEPSSPPSGDEP